MAQTYPARPVRGTQLLVEHIGSVLRRPSLVAIEIRWRWLFGIPFLWASFRHAKALLADYPLYSSGLDSLDAQNPWIAARQIADGIAFYAPHVAASFRWLLPVAALSWILISGIGRTQLIQRIEPRAPFRPLTMMAFQAGWLALFALSVWGWWRSMAWVAATHINGPGEPDLIGYFIWAIFLSLGFFTVFALVSWPLSIAPILALLDRRSTVDALAQSFRLGKAFASKLVEINLVMGIVKLALIVLAMVFSAAPLPFGDELGSSTLHMVSAASVVFYLLANDFFQVVRLKAFVEFWKVFRSSALA